MTISWYSVSISLQSSSETIFNGYFSVDDATDLVTSFYKTINGLTNFNNDILVPAPLDIRTAPRNDNKFPITIKGIALTIPILHNAVSYDKIINYHGPNNNTETNYNLFNSLTWEQLNDINVSILPILNPTIYVSDGLQLYNFLNSNRKQCIITNDINANFNLRSFNGIKTISSNNLIKITKM